MRTIAGTAWSVEDARAAIVDGADKDPSGCWLWRRSKVNGYGRVAIPSPFRCKNAQATMSAHRLSYEAFVGPIPSGMFVCHSCDVRPCCNPEHLWVGTHAQNVADMKAKRRAAHGEIHHRAKLTEADVVLIRESSMSPTETAKAFGVSLRTVYGIRRGRVWRHVEGGRTLVDGERDPTRADQARAARKDARPSALAHAVEVFEHLAADSADDALLSDELGDAHRREAATLAVLREMLTEARRGRS